MEKEFILVIDEGTTGVRAFLYDKSLKVVCEAYKRIELFFPGQYKVEQSANEIFEKTLDVCREVISKHGISAEQIACAGITNQRTSWLFWNKETGEPLRNMVLWLDTRGLLQKQKFIDDPVFNEKFPGIAPYLPGLFMPLVLDNIKEEEPEFVKKFEKPTTLYGNVDSWLIWKLTGGKVHATSPSTASNSTVYYTQGMVWNLPMLEHVGMRWDMMPSVLDESDCYGVIIPELLGAEIPIYSAIADQQAALFSQGCLEENTVKCTNGTGTFMDVNMGTEFRTAGVLNPSVAWRFGETVTYMAEGIFSTAGACLEWARHNAKLFDSFEEMNVIAAQVEDNGGVYFVPALTGLISLPYTDESARGAYFGLSPNSTKAHMVRATLEGIAFAASSLMEEANRVGINIKQVKISGGVSKSDLIGQIIANLTGEEVVRPKSVEATALGAAEMAAIKLGLITTDMVDSFIEIDKAFTPDNNQEKTKKEYDIWKNSVSRTLNWLK